MSWEPGKARLFFEQMGPALVVHRRRRSLSGAVLARMASIGKSQLSKYENGRELPKLETLTKLLDSLGLEPIWFFYTVHRLSSSPPDIEAALALDLSSDSPSGILSRQEEEGFQRVFSDLLRLHRITLETRTGAMGSPRRASE